MPENCIEEVSYGVMALGMNRKIEEERIPISGTIELTRRCNLRCRHCYCNQAADNPQALGKEISTEDVFRVLDDSADRGCLWMLFTGGEPLLRPDFRDIYKYAKQKGFLIMVFTNATLVDEGTADFFKEWPAAKIEVSIYGANKNTYENVTGVKGSFERCMAGISRLKERGITPDIKTMAMTLNKEELNGIKEFSQSIGAKFRFDAMLHCRIDGGGLPHQFRLSPAEIALLDMQDKDKIKAWEKAVGFFEENASSSGLLYTCGAGRTMFFVGADARMSLCSMALEPGYDLRGFGFRRIWDEFFPAYLNKRIPKDYACIDCELSAYCQHCPGWAQWEKKDDTAVVGFFCQVAAERKKVLEKILKKEEVLN